MKSWFENNSWGSTAVKGFLVAAALLGGMAAVSSAGGSYGTQASSAPVNTGAPSVSGTAEVGSTLTADPGTWTGDPTPTFAYQWQRCEDGPAVASVLGPTRNEPLAIALDSSGNVYTADDFTAANPVVTKITPNGTSSTFGLAGSSPQDIAVDQAGNVYTTNFLGNTVTKITPGGVSSTFGTTGSRPIGIAIDSQGNVWTANSTGNSVTKITPGGSSTNITFPGIAGAGANHLAIDSADNVYASWNNTFIYKIAPNGSYSQFAYITPGMLVSGIAVDSAGNVYTSNQGNGTVGKFTPGGVYSVLASVPAPTDVTLDSAGNIYTSAGYQVWKTTPDGTPARLAFVTGTPYGIAVDSNGTVYLPMYEYDNVTKIAPSVVCTDIPSATDQTYTLTGADEGKTVRVKVTATNSEGSANSNSGTTSTIQPQPIPANTSPPTISGTAEVGQTLTADNGTWTGNPTSYAYQWQRCDADGNNCVDIASATGQTYALAGDDEGKKVRVKVTATNGAGSSTPANSAPTSTVAPLPVPTNTSPPTISGTAEVGQTLTADNGTWTGNPTSYAYQWQRCDADGNNCVDIGSATGQTYALTGDDDGKKVKVKVTATNGAGSSTPANSAPTSTVAPLPAPRNTSPPTISGTPEVGETLTAGNGTWSPTPTSYAYQWQRCDADGNNCVDISSATSQTYVLTGSDTGKKILVKVTATNPAGSTAADSAQVGPVAGPPANTSPPTISGTPEVGETLTANNGTWTAQPAPSFAYQWQRCDSDGTNCVDISSATNQTYVQAEADTGKKIRVKVTATNSEGSATADTAQVGPVAGPPVNSSPPTISGTPEVGETLTANPGSWAAQPAPTFTYQWLRCDENGDNCVEIPSATGQSYVLTGSDEGSKIRVRVTASNSEGGSSAESEPTEVVAPAPGKPKLKVSVSSPKRVRAGKSFKVKVKTLNRATPQSFSTASSSFGTTAKKVKTCVKLPPGVVLVDAGSARVSGRTLCWTRSSLAAGKSVTYRFRVRTTGSAGGTTTFKATTAGSNAAGARARANGSDRIKVTPKPQPKPKPPTG